MASHVDVSTELANIASAIYGKDVRGSIHDGIQKIANAVNGAIDTQLLTVDGSLTQQGAGADAAIVGAMFSQIQDSIDAQAGIDRIAAISVGSDATEIASGTNLNSITAFGIYVSKSQAISASLINCPISDNSFVMYVERVAGATAAFIQRIIPYHPERCDEWTRIYSSTHGTWGEWIETGDAEGRAYGKYAKPVAVNTDLNDYTTPGVYVRDSADGYSIGHDPVNNMVEDTHYSYILYVERIAPSKTAVRQRVVVYDITEPQEWVRIFTGSSWTEWKKNPSRKDLDNIQNEIENLNVETDKTLKVADKPADSQAVGQALKKIPLQDIVGVNRFPDNLVVIDDCVLNSKVNPSTGAFQSDISYFRTGYMSVTPGVSYKANHGRDLAWYDNNKGYISGVSGTTVQEGVTAPNNARFAAFSVHKLNDGISTNAAYLYFAETASYDEKTIIDGLETATDKTLSLTDKPADSKTVGDALTTIRSNFADEFSTSTAYAIGDIVLYQGQLYKFKAAHAAGAWNSAHVDAITVDSEIGEVKDALEHLDVDDTLSVSGKPADAKTVGSVITSLVNNISSITPYINIDPSMFDIGNITMSASGWTYTNKNSRVRTREGSTIHLKTGDVISLSNYTTAQMYLGWRLSGETYKTSNNWITSDYTVSEEGDYVILLMTNPESTVTDKMDLLSLLSITNSDSILNDLDNIGNSEVSYGSNFWENGVINTSSGATVVAQNRIKTKENIGKSVREIEAQSDYLFAIACFVGNACMGTYDGTTVAKKGAVWFSGKINVSELLDDYEICIMLKQKNDNNVTPQDGENVTLTLITDETLSIGGISADAKTCGEKFNLLSESISNTQQSGGDYIELTGISLVHRQMDSQGNVGSVERKYLATTEEIFTLPYNTVMLIDSPYTAYYVRFDDNNTYDYSSSYDTRIFIQANKKYRICFGNGTTTDTIDFGDLLKHVRYYSESRMTNNYNSYTFNANRVLSANHRGYNHIAPENTLPAFRMSKQVGFDFAESDVGWTSDDVPVMLHDATINRTARNADGTEIATEIAITDVTYSELLTYDFGIAKGSEYAGTKIPTFEEFITLCKKIGIGALIQIGPADVEAEKYLALLDLVIELGMENSVLWLGTIEQMRVITDHCKCALVGIYGYSVTKAQADRLATCLTGHNKVYYDFGWGKGDSSTTLNWDNPQTFIELSARDILVGIYDANTVEKVLACNIKTWCITSDYEVPHKVFYNANIGAEGTGIVS